jgi:hypothetical protein
VPIPEVTLVDHFGITVRTSLLRGPNDPWLVICGPASSFDSFS